MYSLILKLTLYLSVFPMIIFILYLKLFQLRLYNKYCNSCYTMFLFIFVVWKRYNNVKYGVINHIKKHSNNKM